MVSTRKLQINTCIALIDDLLHQQINNILHHPAFQKLEATWRNLEYLVKQVNDYEKIKIRILPLTVKELAKDINNAIEFDQSQLFQKIYNAEFDQAGGEPYGLLIGDYYSAHKRYQNDKLDVETLTNLAKIAAAAFCPFIAGLSPDILGLDKFSDLQYTLDLEHSFQQTEFLPWKTLRADEDSRFLGLLLPRVLLRLPYSYETTRTQEDYLWGNPAFCFAANVARAFSYYGWFSEINGVEKDNITKGIVTGLPQQSYFAGCFDVNTKSALETSISPTLEKALAEQGFIAMSDCKFSPYAAFYSSQSLQTPKLYYTKIATINANLPIKLDYVLCVSRFAHYIKIMLRDKIGKFSTTSECENYLQEWLMKFCAIIDDMSAENKAKYPLREAKVQVYERAGKPRNYHCVIQLRPHFQAEELDSSLRLVTEIKL